MTQPEIKAPKPDPREARATTSPLRLLFLTAQLALLSALMWKVHPSYFPLSLMILGGFVVHYWLPFRLKEPFWLALSLGGGTYIAGYVPMGATVALGLVIYAICASPLAYWTRFWAVFALYLAILWAGTLGRAIVHPPPHVFSVFASAFMLRIFPYMYDLKHFKKRADLREFIRYFFMLPQFKLNAPIVDFGRLGQGYFQRDIHTVAQQGILWIVRASVHVSIYEWAKPQLKYALVPGPRTFQDTVSNLFFAYLIYLRTSGVNHGIIGIMKLFGYDLPETNKWFAFSHSPLDQWRRANIYWKDAVLKVIYMPVYFVFRKRSELTAKVIATFFVFLASWFLHIWQVSWFSDLKLSLYAAAVGWPTDIVVWTIAGFICSANVLVEAYGEKRNAGKPRVMPPRAKPAVTPAEKLRAYLRERIALAPGMSPLRGAIQICATLILLSMVFSLVHAPSVKVWARTLIWWY
jgi:hypothetical protein